ncbi:MAG: glucose-6-phosphate dehydrogenase [Rickettsiales bacterium]|nr:glucose-6-phosphate dehydrogenase [Rickettsiales bacterium]
MAGKRELSASDIIIFGGTGDLSLRKILPALYHRLREDQLPPETRVWVLGRDAMEQDAFQAKTREKCEGFITAKEFVASDWDQLAKRMQYVQLDAKKTEDFQQLKARIEEDPRPVRVFYLSTPAGIFGAISQQLADVGLITPESRVVMEKPIGYDLKSFREINGAVLTHFDETQIYRIDHYLGKETVQNLLVLRFANNVFERIWNGNTIDHVQITVAEQTGLESRHAYYDDAGATRDMVQNHLLQLLCLVAMEPPNQVTPDAVRDEKLKVLRALRPMTPDMVLNDTVRGQYGKGSVKGQSVESYLEEIEKKSSNTETYVAVKAWIDNWRWSGIPFYLRTGKRMHERYSEIVIYFSQVPHAIFPDQQSHPVSNKLVIRLQPDEYINFQMVTKVPGPGGYRLKPVNLKLSLGDEFGERFPDAYERLLMDVVRGNPTLFMRSDEVEAAWQWIEPILTGWGQSNAPLHKYEAGSRGPQQADALIMGDKRAWYSDE